MKFVVVAKIFDELRERNQIFCLVISTNRQEGFIAFNRRRRAVKSRQFAALDVHFNQAYGFFADNVINLFDGNFFGTVRVEIGIHVAAAVEREESFSVVHAAMKQRNFFTTSEIFFERVEVFGVGFKGENFFVTTAAPSDEFFNGVAAISTAIHKATFAVNRRRRQLVEIFVVPVDFRVPKLIAGDLEAEISEHRFLRQIVFQHLKGRGKFIALVQNVVAG